MAQGKQIRLRRDPNAAPYSVLRHKIIEARVSANMTQECLAKRLGKPQSFVAKIEGGERSIDVIEFVAIAQLINLDLQETFKALAKSVTENS